MRGIGRVVLLLLYGSGLQRWVFGIGLALTLVGCIGIVARGPWVPSVVFMLGSMLGTTLVTLSPAISNGILFRSVSAPRAMLLIPGGRTQLLLGALCAQLLLALFVAVAVSLILPHAVEHQGAALALRTPIPTAFVLAFGSLTARPGSQAMGEGRLAVEQTPADTRPARAIASGQASVRSARITSGATSGNQVARSATVTGTRAALSAGRRPPMTPMPSAQPRPNNASEGVTAM